MVYPRAAVLPCVNLVESCYHGCGYPHHLGHLSGSCSLDPGSYARSTVVAGRDGRASLSPTGGQHPSGLLQRVVYLKTWRTLEVVRIARPCRIVPAAQLSPVDLVVYRFSQSEELRGFDNPLGHGYPAIHAHPSHGTHEAHEAPCYPWCPGGAALWAAVTP